MLRRYLLARTLSTISLKERAHTDQARRTSLPFEVSSVVGLTPSGRMRAAGAYLQVLL
jgi:hypothetical protein